MADSEAERRPAWHALLAPLPAEAVPVCQPVAPPEVLASAAGASLAGWAQLLLYLSAGAAGSRWVLVVLDDSGAPLSASDAVLYRVDPAGTAATPPCDASARIHQESVGGRFERDGSFRGTRWRSVALDVGGDEDLAWESSAAEPSGAEVAALRALVADVLSRRPPRE
jgi:hypothetical protein